MNRRIQTRLAIIVAVMALCVFLVFGFPPSMEKMRQRIRLGLDLRGGTHLVLQVVTDDAIRAETDQTIESIRSQLQRDAVSVQQLTRSQNDEFTITGVDPNKDADFRRLMTDTHPEWDISTAVGGPPNSYTVKLKPVNVEQYRVQAVDQAINTIRNRVDQTGIAEAVIQKHGGPGQDEILVQFPGVDDPARVKNIIRSTALLQFKIVEGTNSYPTQAAALQQYNGVLPGNLEIIPSKERSVDGTPMFYIVQRVAGITGRDLKGGAGGSAPTRDENGRPAVSFNLTADGAQKMGRLTEQNVGKLLAIVLDGRIESAPVIRSRIVDSGQITGTFTQQEVQDLVLTLRSGALPASIVYLQEQVVGPSLGADSIRQGITAGIVALLSVIAFVLFYYRASGVNATLAMIMNLIILFAAMAWFGATLTLPGIAGVILTIGMGIDSNVLIFERIREELRAGKTAVSAVMTSFKRVFVTLVDTHLAALISATFLFLFGEGPVKGFAVTLLIGLVSNMFTAVFVSRTLFELTLSRKGRAEALSI